jgi:hypothetical protein
MTDWRTFADRIWGDGEDLGALSMAVRALAMFFIVLCVTHAWLAALIEGKRVPLYVGGSLLHDELLRTSISPEDLLESHRLETQADELRPGEEAFLERNGRISFVRHDKAPPG